LYILPISRVIGKEQTVTPSRMLQAKGELGGMSAVSPRFFVETSLVAISMSPKDV